MNPNQFMHQTRHLDGLESFFLGHGTQCKYLRYGPSETIQELVWVVLEGLVFLDHTANISRPSKRRV